MFEEGPGAQNEEGAEGVSVGQKRSRDPQLDQEEKEMDLRALKRQKKA